MEIILNHCLNKPQDILHVNSLLDQRYIFYICFCYLCNFHYSCSAIQVEFSV